ncbi:MAG: GNAT family N-acetyltransferase [Cyanobacteriota bacterium]|nr:GNAT family N-acetyltransferase [Cyanobacteriota bacterium]
MSHNEPANERQAKLDTARFQPARIICHGRWAPALQLGLDPDLRPVGAMQQLQQLLNANAFWGTGRSLHDLRRMVHNSAVCVSAWRGRQLIGFGRATSDAIFRGAIWDVVVDSEHVGQGIGQGIMAALLESKALGHCERIYLMTTNSAGFYEKLGFQRKPSQILMVLDKSG